MSWVHRADRARVQTRSPRPPVQAARHEPACVGLAYPLRTSGRRFSVPPVAPSPRRPATEDRPERRRVMASPVDGHADRRPRDARRPALPLREYLRTLRGPRESAIFARDDPLPGLVELPLLGYVLARRVLSGGRSLNDDHRRRAGFNTRHRRRQHRRRRLGVGRVARRPSVARVPVRVVRRDAVPSPGMGANDLGNVRRAPIRSHRDRRREGARRSAGDRDPFAPAHATLGLAPLYRRLWTARHHAGRFGRFARRTGSSRK